MKRHIILRGEEQFQEMFDAYQELGAEDELHEVIIRPALSSLSARQMRLYWLWMGVISGHTGYTKDELHDQYKEKFLVRIFETNDKDYAQMLEAVRQVHRDGKKGTAKHLKVQIIRMTSITDAKTPWMSEYLDEIKLDCITKLQLQLPIPEDIGRYHSK